MKVQSTLWIPELSFTEREALEQLTAIDPPPHESACLKELLAQLPALAGMEEFYP